MHRTAALPCVMLVILLASVVALAQDSAKRAARGESPKNESFDSAIKRIRETWVREFNAGHADKVADLYAPEAVLMRGNGSLHNRDSILADVQRSIATEAHNYVVYSLQSDGSGDLGYDTGAYNENFPHHVAEGNYLIVIKRIGGEWKIVAHAAVPNPRPKP